MSNAPETTPTAPTPPTEPAAVPPAPETPVTEGKLFAAVVESTRGPGLVWPTVYSAAGRPVWRGKEPMPLVEGMAAAMEARAQMEKDTE
jgi:hypothetical protein